MSERKLRIWQSAGLIDAATAARIRDWESQNSRPWGLWALIGLGALAIGLGLVSVVAANWDEIPGEARLGMHFALMVGLAAYLWWRKPDQPDNSDFFHDAWLFIFGALGLTFFGHLGQVYQTNAPLWQPLLAWLILYTPLLLKFGRGWPAATMWFAGLMGTVWSHAIDDGNWLSTIDGQHEGHERGVLYWGLISSPPMIVAGVAAWQRGRSSRPEFWRQLEQMAVLTILVGVSATIVGGNGWGHSSRMAVGIAALQAVFLIGAGFVTWQTRQTRSGEATAAILGTAALLNIANPLLHFESLLPALLFMTLWSAVAYAAIHANWRLIFQIAVAILAIRLIVLSFELATDLLTSGVGLIIGGMITLAVAWLAVRLTKRFAPPKEVEA